MASTIKGTLDPPPACVAALAAQQVRAHGPRVIIEAGPARLRPHERQDQCNPARPCREPQRCRDCAKPASIRASPSSCRNRTMAPQSAGRSCRVLVSPSSTVDRPVRTRPSSAPSQSSAMHAGAQLRQRRRWRAAQAQTQRCRPRPVRKRCFQHRLFSRRGSVADEGDRFIRVSGRQT